MHRDESPSTCQCDKKKKKKKKGLKVSNFALLWVVFKWHHGSEGVNDDLQYRPCIETEGSLPAAFWWPEL